MDIIAQHNFNTGFGDGLFAMTEYLSNIGALKEYGFSAKLHFNLSRNLYFKEKTPLDYLNNSEFKIFDAISTEHYCIDENIIKDYTCVFTHANAKHSQHYWDLFVHNSVLEKYRSLNYTIKQFNIKNMMAGELPEFYPKLSEYILNKFSEFKVKNNLDDYDAIYFRTQDLQEELDFLEKNKHKLKEILFEDTSKKIFYCSNSKEFKKYIKTLSRPNLYNWEMPLEEEWGGNHLLHQTIDPENLHQRTIYSLLDMWTLCSAKKINFFTTWGRYSNFLIYAPINHSTVVWY